MGTTDRTSVLQTQTQTFVGTCTCIDCSLFASHNYMNCNSLRERKRKKCVCVTKRGRGRWELPHTKLRYAVQCCWNRPYNRTLVVICSKEHWVFETNSSAIWDSRVKYLQKWEPVADAGIVIEGFCYCIARENFGARPTFAENHAHFRAFFDKFLVLPVNPFICDRDLC